MASPPGCSLKSLKSPPIDDGDDAAEVKEEQNEENEEEVKMCDLKIRVGPLVANINA